MNLIGKAHDPKFWSEVVRNDIHYKNYLDERLADWDKYCEGKVITELKYSDFKKFFTTGNRSVYESQYFKRRGMLVTSAILSLIYPEEEKYIDYLNDVIFAICDEYTWSVPAHHPKLEVYDKTFIDLFASETGFSLAEIYTLLGDRLDKIVRDRIKIEIQSRIIDSFMSDRYFWWAERCTNNWAAVCSGSVGCTFMLMRPDLFPEVKGRIGEIMERFLSGFESDGYCLEGTGYWHYGFGFFVTYADMLKAFTEGADDYFKRDKVRVIATFLQKMFLSGTSAVSFADGGDQLKYHIGLLHYLKNLYPDDVKVYSPEYSYMRDNCHRTCLSIRAASWLSPEIYDNPESVASEAEYYAEESKWYVRRTKNYGFAAKGGNNGEHHNHNDVGTFIFAKDGKQLITDMGRGAYTKQYFRNETRYEFIECSSLGHCVPYFDGDKIQKMGSDFRADDYTYREGYLAFDMAKAYGDEAVRSVKREFRTYSDYVTVTDTFDCDCAITDRIVSVIKPEIFDGTVKIESAEITFDKDACAVSVSEEVTSKKFTVYLIDFKLNDGVKSFEMKLK
ncbi:MAG: hypothetical protein E7673_06100 [Ruminococcaceae bacterium]|nr:hypothetical protein [Oscillospiraceae bacterium]